VLLEEKQDSVLFFLDLTILQARAQYIAEFQVKIDELRRSVDRPVRSDTQFDVRDCVPFIINIHDFAVHLRSSARRPA
jgi:hypothetical protein